jgi:hypothetical protein
MTDEQIDVSAYEKAADRRAKIREINLAVFKWACVFFLVIFAPVFADATMVLFSDGWVSLLGIRYADAAMLAKLSGGMVGFSILVLILLPLARRNA